MNNYVNDFVVRFANVNGTGSASANNMFAKSIFRMGIPVAPKNIFPSNIQGLPTWYEVRVSEKGYLGRREGIDVMVAVNPQSFARDVADVKPGGYLIYDSTKPLHQELRNDITFIGIPMTALCLEHYSVPRLQQLFKNIVYVGALSKLLDIEVSVFEEIFAEQFAGKEKLIAPNMQALNLGRDYIAEHYNFPLKFRLERRDLVKDAILIDGNTACGIGAVYGGATVAAWYPITPSTSLMDGFDKYAAKLRIDAETGKRNYAIVQMEDELASMGVVIGAGWNGARAFTATSGPGVSLMSEFIGLSYFAEVPAVLVDVQRGGPSTGMPTRTQQSDLISAAYASHGDTKHILLFPSTPKECFDMMAMSFDLAEQLQTLVIVMTDLDLGMNDHMSPPFEWDDQKDYQRGKVLNAQQIEEAIDWGRYKDVDGDGIPYRTLPGTHPSKGAYFTRGTSRDEYAKYTEEGAPYVRNMDRLLKKWETAKSYVPRPEIVRFEQDASEGLIYFGTTAWAAKECTDRMEMEGVLLNAMRIKAFPFNQEVSDYIHAHDIVYVVEQNRDAQLKTLLVNELSIDPNKLISILNYDGFPITADKIGNLIHQLKPSAVTDTAFK
ncbi:MAG: 2-oxoacid:acceptor oxidoreductase subunit alpha [Saprospiraceae bacterium]